MSDDEKLTLDGTMDFTVRFKVNDLVALVETFPKMWLELTKDRLKEMGGYQEYERFSVFLGEYLDSASGFDVFGDQFTDFDVQWDDTDYRWTEEHAAKLNAALPPHLRFGEEGEPPDTSLLPGPDDVPLPGLGEEEA